MWKFWNTVLQNHQGHTIKTRSKALITVDLHSDEYFWARENLLSKNQRYECLKQMTRASGLITSKSSLTTRNCPHSYNINTYHIWVVLLISYAICKTNQTVKLVITRACVPPRAHNWVVAFTADPHSTTKFSVLDLLTPPPPPPPNFCTTSRTLWSN